MSELLGSIMIILANVKLHWLGESRHGSELNPYSGKLLGHVKVSY